MKELRVFSEEPEIEMWRMLMHYSYHSNIKKYLNEKGSNFDDELIDFISGSFLQAKEYFFSANNSTLQTSPLLLYYGASNLIIGAISLINGERYNIAHHGMILNYNESANFLAEHEIHFIHPNDGAIHVYRKMLGDNGELCGKDNWSIKELLGSVMELMDEFISCYGEKDVHIIPLDIIKNENGKFYKTNRKYDSDFLNELINKIPGFSVSFLRPTINNEGLLILREKMGSHKITYESFSGQPYLMAGHKKGNELLTIEPIFIFYIILFALGSICRYKPEIWNPFVRNDTTGERLIVERFLSYAKRILPNIVLNYINNKEVIFSNDRYQVIDRNKVMNEYKIKEFIEATVRKQIDVERR